MVKSIGLDIVEVKRIKKDIDKYGDSFINRILGHLELAIYEKRRDKSQFLAGRFAAKEAIIKGLGIYISDRPPYKDLQIIQNKSGQPELVIPDNLKKKLNNVNCLISITHEQNYAAAVAVFVEDK